MTRFLVSFTVLLCCLSAYGQYSFKEHYFDRNNSTNNKNNYLELSSAYQINSSSFSNAFLSEIYTNGSFSEEMKASEIDRLNKNNSIGFGAWGNFLYKRKFDAFTLKVGLSTQVISNNKLSKDFVKLALNGNAPYAGEILDLSKTSVKAQAFHKLSIGGEKTINKRFLVGGAINLYQGYFHSDLKIERGDFFTKEDGSEVLFDTKFNQTTAEGKGYGAGLDLYFVSKFKKGNLILHVEDLGFISYKNTTSYSADSNFAFSGIDVLDVFDINNSRNKDETVPNYFGVDSTTEAKTFHTPTKITVGYQEKVSEKLFVEVYANYQFLATYIPQLIIKPSFFFGKNFSVAPVINLGGFGKADLGLNLSYHHSNYFVTMDLLELENLLAPNASSGRASFLKAGLLF